MDPIFNLVPFVILIPLAGLLINLIFGRRLGQPAAGIVASTATALSFAIAVILAVALSRNPEQAVVVRIAEWIRVGTFSVDWACGSIPFRSP
jgi:NADH-quinone oxidoreductase subunit L